MFSVMVRRWVTLKSSCSTTNLHSPQDIMVNESSIPPPPFTSSQTVHNLDAKSNTPELCVDENGKVSEIKLKTPSPMEAKHVDPQSTSALFMLSPTDPKHPHGKTSQIPFSSLNPNISGEEGEEEDNSGTTERAIITTHISAQKKYDDTELQEELKASGEKLDNEGEGRLGGIRVVVEQVYEVEIDVASRGRTSTTARKKIERA